VPLPCVKGVVVLLSDFSNLGGIACGITLAVPMGAWLGWRASRFRSWTHYSSLDGIALVDQAHKHWQQPAAGGADENCERERREG
jgi:hypothetical protein